MSRIKTDYTLNGQSISYEITEDGYFVYLDNSPWIHQYEPYIPYPDLGYEGSCIKQIEDMVNQPEPQPIDDDTTIEGRLNNLEDYSAELLYQVSLLQLGITENDLEESEV